MDLTPVWLVLSGAKNRNTKTHGKYWVQMSDDWNSLFSKQGASQIDKVQEVKRCKSGAISCLEPLGRMQITRHGVL